MLVTSTNIKLHHDDFIDGVYGLYHTLLTNGIFEKDGFENNTFKIWKHNDSYYMLNKVDGVLVMWERLLGYKLRSNFKMTAKSWKNFCDDLWSAIDNPTDKTLDTEKE